MKRIYVAGKLDDMACNYVKNLYQMIKSSEEVRKAGFAIFVPGIDFLLGVVHGNWKYEDYFNNSQPWLDISDAVFVQGDNWKESKGTKKEIERAREKGIPLFFDLKVMINYFKDKEE